MKLSPVARLHQDDGGHAVDRGVAWPIAPRRPVWRRGLLEAVRSLARRIF